VTFALENKDWNRLRVGQKRQTPTTATIRNKNNDQQEISNLTINSK
jgi:hypothetical protein